VSSRIGPILAQYTYKHLNLPAHSVTPEAFGTDWLAQRLPVFATDLGRREEFTITAKELLPIFEADPNVWDGCATGTASSTPDVAL
jgi:hypothetical protein